MNIEIIKHEVSKLFKSDVSGHDDLHMFRVYDLATKFAEAEEGANKDLIAVASLLHDCDDYKVFGLDNEVNFPNTNRIMDCAGINDEMRTDVLEIISTMSYNKLIAGVRPKDINGRIVADADMCDALGATGIIRAITFCNAKKQIIWDKDIWPLDYKNITYKNLGDKRPLITHFFEKLLRMKDFCMTESGKTEAESRHVIMVDFLRQFFKENNAPDWLWMLENKEW